MIPDDLRQELEADRALWESGDIDDQEHGVRVAVIMLRHPDLACAIVAWGEALAQQARDELASLEAAYAKAYPNAPHS